MQRPDTNRPEFRQLLAKARDAKGGGEPAWSALSTGERLAVALVLNRPEWISAMGYSLAEALDRVGLDWLSFVPEVARQLRAEEVNHDRD